MLKELSDAVAEHYEWQASDVPRIPLGFRFFDEATHGGIALGEVLMMLAYSGVGKTWWACNVVVNNPQVPVLFFSLEMQARALTQRLAAVAYEVPTSKIEADVAATGRSEHLERLVEDYPYVVIDDTPAHSLSGMHEAVVHATEMLDGVRPQLVLADYLELIKAGPASSGLEAVDKVSRNTKNFARQNDVAFVVLHQTNANEGARIQEGYDRTPGSRVDNGHLPLTRKAARFGGDVAADYTIGVYRPALNPNMHESVRHFRDKEIHMQLLKNRAGHVLHLSGVEHEVDVNHWKIREPNDDSYARSAGINPDTFPQVVVGAHV